MRWMFSSLLAWGSLTRPETDVSVSASVLFCRRGSGYPFELVLLMFTRRDHNPQEYISLGCCNVCVCIFRCIIAAPVFLTPLPVHTADMYMCISTGQMLGFISWLPAFSLLPLFAEAWVFPARWVFATWHWCAVQGSKRWHVAMLLARSCRRPRLYSLSTEMTGKHRASFFDGQRLWVRGSWEGYLKPIDMHFIHCNFQKVQMKEKPSSIG